MHHIADVNCLYSILCNILYNIQKFTLKIQHVNPDNEIHLMMYFSSHNAEKVTFISHFRCETLTAFSQMPVLDADTSGNYRPMSDLSIVSKTLEHVTVPQMESRLHSAGLIPPHQLVYGKGHSTESSASIVLDLSAAFDTVDHAIIIIIDIFKVA